MDWTSLPVDILNEFMVRLVVVDWITFGAVCKAWKRAADTASSLRLRPKAEPPWLMFPADGDTPQHLAVADVFSLSDGRRRSITLPAPPIQSRVWIGSANGWVVTADGECELHLLNPISGVQRSLPSITTTGYFDALPRTEGGKARRATFLEPVEMSAEDIQSSRLLKAVPLFDPSSGKYSIMMMHNPQNKLVFAREGDPKWVPLRAQYRYEDVIVYHGRFCTVTIEGLVQTWEHDNSTMTFNPKSIAPQLMEPEENGIPLYFKKYLAESPDGNLILIWREHYSERCDESDSDDDVSIEREEDEDDYNISCCCEEIEELEPDPTIRFQVFVLDKHPIGSEWREVHDFGGASIFIGCNSATFFSSGEIPGLAADCIYFTDNSLSFVWESKELERDIGVFDMKDKMVKPMPILAEHIKSWPPPIWVTPSMT
uniref:Uncharacterized protein n=1 Tax=Oryza punctata TaxID=4537 RepID=A0A0E0JLV2_ORYPU